MTGTTSTEEKSDNCAHDLFCQSNIQRHQHCPNINQMSHGGDSSTEISSLHNTYLGNCPFFFLHFIVGGGLPPVTSHINVTWLPREAVRTCLDKEISGGAIPIRKYQIVSKNKAMKHAV